MNWLNASRFAMEELVAELGAGARNRPPTAEPRPKRHKIVSAAAEIISQGSVPRRSTAKQ